MSKRSHAALYIWDYFFISSAPEPGDEKLWAVIERATCRIRETEVYLDPPNPADVRLRNARRMRNAVRVARRNIDRLSAKPEQWIIDQLAELEVLSARLIEKSSEEARLLVVD